MDPPSSQLSLCSHLSTDPETEGFDLSAGKIWFYPENFPLREYQYSIVSTALFNNTLVCLPTGLGKTFIAAVVMYNFRRWYPQGKIVFLAPTKALVGQQIYACHNIMGIPSSETIELTGTTHQKNRYSAWIKHSIIFATPQVFHKDLEKDIVPVKNVKCVVIDEAHKALGKHSYCESIRILSSKNKYFRVIGLSATPGSKLDNVLEVIRNLHISHLELRDETSKDIVPYTNNRKIDILLVPLSNELGKYNDRYIKIMDRHVKVLINYNVITGSTGNLSKGRIFYLTKEFKEKSNKSGNYGQIMKTLNILNTMYHAYDLMIRHGLRAFCHFYRNHSDKFWMASEQSLLALLDEIEEYLGQFPSIRPLPNGEIPEVPRNIVFGHNKFYKLQELLRRHFKCSGEGNPDTRAIVFVEYRDIVNEVYVLLLQSRPLIRPQMFVGQAGQKQKEQSKALEDFRENRVNVLISTSVGEEGLDVGEVDLIICFDISQQSPIRLVQRMGRTGRKRDGHIIVLVTDGKEHQTLKNAIAKRDSLLTKVLYSSNILSNLYDGNPRMVPPELNPECHKLMMKIQPKTPKIVDKGRKRNAKENVESRPKKDAAHKNKSNSSNAKQKGGGQSMMDKYLQQGFDSIMTQANTNGPNYIKAEDVLLLTNDDMANEFLTLCAMKKSAPNRNQPRKSDWFHRALDFPKTTPSNDFDECPKLPNTEIFDSLSSWIRSLSDIPKPPNDFVEDEEEDDDPIDDIVFTNDQKFEYDVTAEQENICSPEIQVVHWNQGKTDKERINPNETIFEHLLASSSGSEGGSQVIDSNCNPWDRNLENRIESEHSKEVSNLRADHGNSSIFEELFDDSSFDCEENFGCKNESDVDTLKNEDCLTLKEEEIEIKDVLIEDFQDFQWPSVSNVTSVPRTENFGSKNNSNVDTPRNEDCTNFKEEEIEIKDELIEDFQDFQCPSVPNVTSVPRTENFGSKNESNVDTLKNEDCIALKEEEIEIKDELIEDFQDFQCPSVSNVTSLPRTENFPDRDEIQSTSRTEVMNEEDFFCPESSLKGRNLEERDFSSPPKRLNVEEQILSPKSLQKAPENHYTSGSEVDMFADDDDDFLKDFDFEYEEQNLPGNSETPQKVSEKIPTQEDPAPCQPLEELNPEIDKQKTATDPDRNLQMSPIISGFTRYYNSQSAIGKRSRVSHGNGKKKNSTDKNPETKNEPVPGTSKSRWKEARKVLEPDFADKNEKRKSRESGIGLPEEKNQSFSELENSGTADHNEVILLDSDEDIFTAVDSFFDDNVQIPEEKSEILENQKEEGGRNDTSKEYPEKSVSKENVSKENQKLESRGTGCEVIAISDDEWELDFEVPETSLQGKSNFFENKVPPGSSKGASLGSPRLFADKSSGSMSSKLLNLKSNASKRIDDHKFKTPEVEKNVFQGEDTFDDDFDVFAVPKVVLDKENSFRNVQTGEFLQKFKRPEVKSIPRSNILGDRDKKLARERLEEKKKQKKKKMNKRRAAALEFLDNEAEVSTDDCVSNGSSGDDTDDDLDGFVSHTQEVHDAVDMRAHYLQAVRSPIARPGAFLMKNVQSRKCNDTFDVYSQVLSQENDTYLCDSFCVDGEAAEEAECSQYSVLEEMEKKLKEKKRKRRNNSTSPKEKRKRRINFKNDSSSEDETEKLRKMIRDESFRLKRMKK